MLRSGKTTPTTDATPASGLTTSTETNTWSKGTGTEDTTGESSTRTIDRIGEDRSAQVEDTNTQVRSAPGTVVNVPGDRASSRLSMLKAELELHNSELARARAATAAAMSQLEIARIELEGSNDAEPQPIVEKSRVEGWISEQHVRSRLTLTDRAQNPGQDTRPPDTARNEPRASNDVPLNRNSSSDMAMLASAIVQAVNSGRSDNAAPKFIHELPHFDGTITEWMAFRSVFNDTSDMFTDVQNVARLRKALRGAARETVRALLFTVSDPYEIIDTLERRYGRPELLILSELETIKRMPRMAEDGRNIGSFASKISNTVAAIKSLNQPQYLYSPELVSRIVEKLSVILKYKWYEFKAERTGAPELELLARFLNVMADQCGAMFAYETARDDRKSRTKPRAVNTARGRGRQPSRSRDNGTDSSSDRSDTENNASRRKTVAAANKPPTKKGSSKQKPRPSRSNTEASAEPKNNKCSVCAGSHKTADCADFSKLSVLDRWNTAKQNKLCFRCLNSTHGRPFRCKYIPCGVNGCEASHHKLLHGHGSESTSLPTHGNVTSINHVRESNTYLKIVPVELSGPTGTTTAYALLDEGSTMTLVERGVADSVVPRGRSQLLMLEGIGGNRVDDAESCRVTLSIRGLCNRNIETMSASTIGSLNLSPQGVSRDLVRQCRHLVDLEDELCYERAKPTVLIGQDNWHLITSRELRVGAKNQPVASLTKLGWVLHGQSSRPRNNVAIVNHVRPTQHEDPALQLIREYFSIESLGIEPRRPKSDPDQRALSILEKTCNKINDNRYEAGLLWRTDAEIMPNNKKQALSRLHNLENKLDKNINLKTEYTKQIDHLIKANYAERVDAPATSPRTWYLPHFSVIHPQKGKVRLVFDAAAKYGGKSLNDALLAGPDFLQSLFGVLIRFREGRIAVVADIKEMFLQIKIIDSDRDSLRFLWRGEDREGPPQEYRMTSLIFGAASSPCTAIYVKNKNADDHGLEHPEVAKATVRNFYMDDYLGSFDDANKAKQVINAMHKVHLNASFELRGYASNLPEVISDVTDKRSSGATTLGKSDTERTLGLIWNHARDTLGFNVNLRSTPASVIRGEALPTKRQVTSAVMSVFDPLGLVSPITMIGKCLIQEIWRSGIGWDDPITKEHHVTWLSFIKNVELLKDLEIDRYVPAPPSGEGNLHIFCDASEKVYSAAVYFVSSGTDGNKTSRLIAGKAKVAPLKPISIPRLELQAAVLGCRLAESVKRESDYKIIKSHYWSDSKTVLAWIKSDPRTFKSFVAHRLAEIESTTTPANWRWVPSAENVADDATKGIPANFNSKHRWFTGPSFIRDDPATWPQEKQAAAPSPPSGEERVLKQVHVTVRRNVSDYLPEVERFSKYTRLVRVAATVLLAAEVFKAKLLKRNTSKELAPNHIKLAELLLAKRSQHNSFAEDIKTIEAGRRPPKKSPFHKLSVKIDRNGVLCLDSRTKEECHLPVLHAKEGFTQLLVHYTHAAFNHGNHQTVMNELRQRYHIIGLRNVIRYICNKCQWCRTYRGTPSKIPLGDLPPERLAQSQPPFTATAVDYFGPIQVTVGRRLEKRWGALYTCLTTRAVHLELATSLSASSMIMSLRRMMARRGTPTVIYSDNGTNFVGAEREITEAMQSNEDSMKAFASEKLITWKRIPPGAPNMGGAWERLVRSVKTALRVTLKEKFPHDEVLHTLLLEAEHVINSRPLTPVNPNLEEEALTPNHFLIGRSSGMTPFGSFKDTPINSHSWRAVQTLADTFWSRWSAEYKPLLMPRLGNAQHKNVKVGDIVIVCDGTMPRGVWPRGEVMKVYPGPDGRVRVTEIRTAAGLIRRPASRLIVITTVE